MASTNMKLTGGILLIAILFKIGVLTTWWTTSFVMAALIIRVKTVERNMKLAAITPATETVHLKVPIIYDVGL